MSEKSCSPWPHTTACMNVSASLHAVVPPTPTFDVASRLLGEEAWQKRVGILTTVNSRQSFHILVARNSSQVSH